GSAAYVASSSAVLTQHVGRALTTTSLVAGPSPSAPGQAVTLTATVVPVAPGAGVPSGTVTFSDGATVLGTAPLAQAGSGPDQAAFTTSALAPGSHSLTAAYQGDARFAGSTSPAVTQVVQRTPTR